MDKKELKKKSKNIQPLLRIGKNGLNNNVYSEIDKLLKKKHLVKIKILNNSGIDDKKDIQEAINNIIKKTSSELVSKIGKTFTIYRKTYKRAEN
jgi:RNA-binding protein